MATRKTGGRGVCLRTGSGRQSGRRLTDTSIKDPRRGTGTARALLVARRWATRFGWDAWPRQEEKVGQKRVYSLLIG